MKVLVLIDSFKGCLSSVLAGEAARAGLLEAGLRPEDIRVFPVSDGGEGFCAAVAAALPQAREARVRACGPLGDPLDAAFLLADCDGVRTAFLESASVCGYGLVPAQQRNPLHTSSYGLGLLLREAVAAGARRIVTGLGGTATCDGGAGMLQALGMCFLDASGAPFAPGTPLLLQDIVTLDPAGFRPPGVPLEGWSDTEAVFCGPAGAVRVFGAQKGLPAALAADADAWMARLAALYDSYGVAGGRPVAGIAGAGAAGGIGGALAALAGALLRSGAAALLRLAGLDDALAAADLVLTGEGRFDAQTATGKLPARVLAAARRSGAGPRVVCLCGSVDAAAVSGSGFDAVIPVTPPEMPLAEALRPETAALLIHAAARACVANVPE